MPKNRPVFLTGFDSNLYVYGKKVSTLFLSSDHNMFPVYTFLAIFATSVGLPFSSTAATAVCPSNFPTDEAGQFAWLTLDRIGGNQDTGNSSDFRKKIQKKLDKKYRKFY